MTDIFAQYSTIIIFLHVISGVIWVGGMIAIRGAVHPALQSIQEPKIKLGKTLEIVKNLFHIVIPFIILLQITAIFMLYGLGFDDYTLIYIKESIWSVMSVNFIYMYIKRYKAEKLFAIGDLKEAKMSVSKLPNLLLPINIILGILAIFLGVVLRGI
jgi:uncharacterized membrane protein